MIEPRQVEYIAVPPQPGRLTTVRLPRPTDHLRVFLAADDLIECLYSDGFIDAARWLLAIQEYAEDTEKAEVQS